MKVRKRSRPSKEIHKVCDVIGPGRIGMSVLTSRDLLLLPQAAPHAPPRVTSTHMPSALCERLIHLCNTYQMIISDNGNSMDCRMKRRTIWIEISRQLNREFNVEFSPDQYKKKYQNLKTALKTKIMNSRRDSTTSSIIPTTSAATPSSTGEPPAKMARSPSPDSKPSVPIPLPPPMMNVTPTIDMQQILAGFFEREQRAISPIEPDGQQNTSELPPGSSAASSEGIVGQTLPEEDPARLFCLSLADPLRKIRNENPTKYVLLKKTITTMIFDAELESIESPMGGD